MKLHLPVKLRASLIAAVIAVTASVYNARAVDYVAPSDTYGWKTNDITLTELYNKLAGNTYTATATTFVEYEFYTEEGKEAVRVGYLGDPASDPSAQRLEWNTFRNQYYWVETVTNADGTTSDVEHYIAPDEVESLVTYNKLGEIDDDADIIIAAKGQTGDVISYTDGKTKLEAEDKIEFQNSVASGVNSVDPGNVKEFIGDQTFIAEKLVINDTNSNGRGAEVVLEDATISGVLSTEIADHSRLTVLNGDTSSLTDEEKITLDIQKISSTATTNWDDANSVTLGAVSGQGSLAIIGGKERSENTVEEGVITEHAYEKAVGKDDKQTVTISSIAGTGSNDFGNIAIANADVTVERGIKNANTLGLVNSVTTVNAKGVTAFGMDVNAESTLLVKHGDIRNTTNQGAGHVDILGKVVAEDGSIGFSNSKHSAGAGIYEGAHVEASKDVLLSNVDTTKAAHLSAGDNLTVTTKSTITDSLNVSAEDDLSLSDGSTISGSRVTVGDDIVVSDGLYGASHLAGTTITVTGQGDDVDAAEQKVTLKNGATMTDSHIVGGNGDILLDGSKKSGGQNMTVVVGLGADAAEGTTADFLNTAEAQKGNLAAVLGAAEGATPLSSAALEAAGMKVGSSIEHTAGNITIKDATVASTLLTGDGNVSIGNPDETGKPGHAGTSAEGPACETIETVLTAIKGGTLVDTDLDAAAGNFPTQVAGSLIDVRDGADSALSIDAAAVSDTIILGINGNIHAEDALVNNNYIDGGAGLDIQHSAVIDTDIVNLTADIKISGDSAIIGTDPDKKVVLTTQGTADFTDKDAYTGGSIILSDVAMENVAIKSGVKTTVNADGTYTHTPVDETTTEVGTSTIPGGTVDGVLAGVMLPYGEIDIDDSTLRSMEITTAKGNVNIDGTTLLDSVVETGAGNIDIVDQSGVGASTITSKGAGNIAVDMSKVSGSSITAAGAGNISITNSEVGEGVSVVAGDATAHVFDTVIKTGGAGNIDIANSSLTNVETATGGDGHISISDATLLDSTATTAGAGDITITTSSISVSNNGADSTLPKATVSTGGAGNIEITANSDLDDTNVSTGGEGHILIDASTVSRGDISTNGAGADDYITITDSTLVDANVSTQGDGDITITTSSISVSDNGADSALPSATISVAGAGDIVITTSDLDDTDVTAGGEGHIEIADSTVSRGDISTNGAGADDYITITDSTLVDANVSTQGDGDITITTSSISVSDNGADSALPSATISVAGAGDIVITTSDLDDTDVTAGGEGHIEIADSTVHRGDISTNGAGADDYIAIVNSTLEDANVSTQGAGDIVITTSSISVSDNSDSSAMPKATISVAGAGNIEITAKSDLDDTNVTTGGEGNIIIDDSAVTNGTVSTAGDGYIAITTDSDVDKATISTEGDGAIYINHSDVDDSLVRNNGTGDITIMNEAHVGTSTVSTQDGNISILANSEVIASEIMSAKDGNITIHDSLVKDSKVHNDHENGGLGDIEIIQSHIVNSSVQTGVGDIQIGVPSTGVPMVAWNAPKDADASQVDTLVEGSLITTTDGGLTIDESYVDSLTSTDADGATTYTKTTIKATDDSIITGSAVSGSDITISEGDLLIRSHAAITGDVNLLVENGTITVNDNDQYAAQFDLDGDRVAPDTRDASIVARELDLYFMKDWSGSLRNGQIAVSDETRICAGETFSLINVNNAEGEAVGTLGDLVEYKGDSANATLNVKGGSIVEANEIYARNTDTDQTPANIHNYFGNVNVGEDSLVTVTDTARIENYTEGTLAGADTEGSKVTFKQDAHLTNATIQGTGEYEGDAVGSKGTVSSILADGHVGNLSITDGGVLSLNAGAQPDDSTHSYISNIVKSDGTINVINQTVSTPELDHADLSLGLNGGTVVLEGVAAADGATIASTKDVNAHVSLLEITNASKAGAPDVTPYGQSTIKTNLTVLDRQYSSTVGDAVTNTGKQLYYAVNADHALTGTETYTVYDPTTGTTSELTAANGDTLKAGQIVVKVDTVVSDTIKLADGTTYNKAVTVDTVGASTLTATEQGYLQRITVPVLDAEGNLQFQPIDGTNEGTLLVGQKYTTYDIITHPNASETGAVTSDQTDGIASLTVAENMDSDNTYIRAYEVVEKDALGNIIVNNGVVSTDPDSGLITINGVVSGQDNVLIADKDITIGGIVTNETDGADYSNSNTVTSMRGDIAIGDQGIVGSDNSLTAHEGSITVTGDIEGHDNTLTADGDITTANITGNANVLYSEKGDIWTDDITGDGNDLHAVAGDIWTEDITGDTNVLLAGKSVTVVGALKGDSNSLTAEDGDVYIIDGILADADDASSDSNIISSTNGDIYLGETDGDSLVGSDNALTATTGDISVMGDIEGDNNTLTATTDGTTGGDIMTDDITGDDNSLTADKAIWTENITGDTNVLVAGTTIDTADITGDSNDLDAVEKITVDGTITGDFNKLTSATDAIEVTGSIVGHENDLDAVKDITVDGDIEGDFNTLTSTEGGIDVTGTIKGDMNALDAKLDISVGGIEGDDNMLTTTEGDIAVMDSIVGEGNDLQAHKGTITVGGNVMGENPTNPNALTAAETITIGGTLGGVGTQLTAYASGLSQDDVAISIGVFAAQGTDLTIATTSSPIYGTTNGNGAIVIGSMDAALNADGLPADVDATLLNSIVSNNSYVQVGGMQGSNAYTTITAAKDVLIGTTGDGAADDGANLTISGKNLVVKSDNGLTLTDSTVNVTGSISGTSLTLTTTGTTAFASTAHNVNLDSLTVGGSASLTAGVVVVDKLTIDGKAATLDSTNLTVNEELTIQNGADAWLNRVTVPVITIDSSSLTTSSINGLESLYVENGSQVSITQGLTLKDSDPNDGIDGGELGVTGGSVLGVTGAIDIEGTITAGDSSGAGTITTASTIKGGSIDASNGATISGTAGIESTGSVAVDKADIITSGTVAAGTTMDVTNGGAVTGKNIDVEGALTVTNGDVTAQGGSIEAASATIKGGELTATKGVALDGDLEAEADDEGVRSLITADITKATNVTLADSDVTGKVNLSGDLAVTNGSVGNVTGARTVQLSHATTGSITMAKASKAKTLSERDVEASDDSIINGDITGANNITLTDSTVEGSLVDMTGALSMTRSTARNANGATSATLDDATIGTLELSGDDADVTAENSSTIASITGANDVTLDASTVAGAVAMSGNLEATNGASMASVAGAKDVTLTDSTVAGTIGMSGALAVTNGSAGNVTGASSATLNKATIGELSLSGDDADVTAENGSTIASITGANDVTLDASTVAGAVAMSGNLEATNGASMASVAGAKDVTLTDSTVAGTIGMSGALAVTNGSAGNVTGATSATLDKATIGELSLSGDDADVTAENGSAITSITGANDVTLDASTVAGTIGMSGALAVTNGSAGNVTGASSATLNKAAIGTLELSGDDADVTAENGSTIASITGANDVTLDASTVAGAVGMSGKLEATNGASMASVSGATDVTLTDSTVAGTIGMSGALAVTNGSAGNVTGASSATLNKATIGELSLSGDDADVTAENDSTIASITGANDVTLTDSLVAGTIGMTGALTADNAQMGDVSGATSAELTNGSAASLAMNNGSVTLANATVNGVVTGATDVKAEHSDILGEVTMKGALTLTDGEIASINADSTVTTATVTNGTIGSGLTVQNAALVSGSTIKGALQAGSADVSNGSTIKGSLTTTAGDATVSGSSTIEGDVKATGGNASVDNSTVAGNLSSTTGSVAVTGGATIKGDATAATSATVSASTVEGSVSGATVTITDGIIGEDVTGTTATITGGTVGGKVDVDGSAELDGVAVSGNVEAGTASIIGGTVGGDVKAETGDATISGGADVTGSVAAANGTVKVDGATVDGTVSGAAANVTNGTIGQGVSSTGDVTITDSTVQAGGVTADGNATLSGTTVTGSVSGATASITGGSIDGDVKATTGDATISGGADVTGSVAAANGTVKVDGATVDGTVSGAAASVTNGTIGQGVSSTGDVTITDSTVLAGGVTADGNATLSGTTVTGSVSGATATITGGSVSDGDVKATTGDATISGGADVTGSVAAANGTVTVDGATVDGTVSGATASVTNGTIGQGVSSTGDVTITDSTVLAGGVTADGKATLSGTTVTGSVSGATATITGGSVSDGDVKATTGDATITGGADVTGSVAAANGTVTVDGATVDGTVSGAAASVTNGTIGQGVSSTGDVTITDSTVLAGGVTADGKATLSGTTVTGTVSGAAATITGGSVSDGDVKATTGDATISGGADVTGSVAAANGTVKVDGATVDGTVSGATASVTNGTIGQGVSSTGDVTITDSTVLAGGVTADGNATLSGTTVTGSVSGATATITGGSVSNGVTADGKATLSGVEVTGSVSGATVSITGGSVSENVTAGDGDVTLSETQIGGNVTAGNLTSDGDVKVDGTVDVSKDLVVNNGNLTADGTVTVQGSTSFNGGSVVADKFSTNGMTVTGDSLFDGNLELPTGKLELTGNTTLVNGNTDVKGGTTILNGAQLNGTLDSSTLSTNGLTATGGSTVTMPGGADLKNGGLLLENSTVNAAVSNAGTVKLEDHSAVNGDITGAKGVTLTDSSVAGSIGMDGALSVTNGSAGDVTGATSATLDKGTTGALSLSGENADVKATNGSDIASITGANDVTLTDSSVTGSIGMDGALSVTNGSAGDVTGATSATLDKGTTGALSLSGENADVKATNGSDIASITGANDVTLTDSSVTGSIGMDGALSVTNGSAGDVTGVTSATLDKGTTGALSLSGENADVKATNGSDIASITGANDVTLSDATVGAIEMTGDLTAENGSVIEGSVTGAKDVTLKDNTTAHDITLTGKLTASEHTSMGAIKAGSTEILGDALGTSLETGDLTVKAGKTYATTGDVVADGKVDIQGAVTSKEGNVSLTGTTGSTIAAPVEATEGKVTLGGEIAVTDDVTAGKELTIAEGAAITATDAALTGDTVDVKGTLSAEDATLTGANGVSVAGTLNAGEGTVIEGTLTGAGTINKTGGDTLELAGDTQLTGGLNVSDESTLSVEDGARLGDVSLQGASIIEVVAAKGENTGKVEASSITLSKDSTMKSDLDLAAKAVDKVTADRHDYNGATLELTTVEPGHEAGIADQTRITVAEGNIVSSLNEDVTHDLETLNAHAENKGDRIDIVLSKNYKGADKTENQSQVANGLASINQEAVKGTELEKVLDAMAHTRSEADAVAALDSLGGMGYAGMQKLIADDAHEHLQTLRSTLDSVSADVRRRFDANGQKIEGVQSSAIAAVVTGGASEVGGNGNCGDYTRSSFGAMLAGAHAVSNEWTFGADLAYSYVDGDCSEAIFTGDAIYFDIAMMQKRGRFSQTGTIGAGLYRFDTERDVHVSAKGHDYSGHAEASTNAAAINLSYEASYDLIRTDNGHTFSSLVMAEASFVQIDGMTEEGMGNAGLRSEFDDMASITLGLGGRYSYSFGKESNPGYFALEAMFVVDAGDDTPKVYNQFIGGGETFNLAGPEAGDIGLRLNAGVLIPIGEQWGIFGNATSEFRSEQSAVGGGVGVKYSF